MDRSITAIVICALATAASCIAEDGDIETTVESGEPDIGQESSALISPYQRYAIASLDSGMCWDVPSSSYYSGAVIQQYKCNGGTNQKFYIKGVDASVTGGVIQTAGNPSYCVGKRSDDVLVLQLCNFRYPGTNSQLWLFPQINGIHYQRNIRNKANNECVDIPYGWDTPVNFNTYSCHNGYNQQWVLLQTP